MLFVDGVEAESGVKRNGYLQTVFRKACWKYCCVVGCPTFLITVALFMLSRSNAVFSVLGWIGLGLLVYCCTCCIIGNRCRSSHYARQADPTYVGAPHVEMAPITPSVAYVVGEKPDPEKAVVDATVGA